LRQSEGREPEKKTKIRAANMDMQAFCAPPHSGFGQNPKNVEIKTSPLGKLFTIYPGAMGGVKPKTQGPKEYSDSGEVSA